MCMKNVNINCLLFNDYVANRDTGITFNGVTTTIHAYKDDKQTLKINRIKLLLLLDWLPGNDTELTDNAIDIQVHLISQTGMFAVLADISTDGRLTIQDIEYNERKRRVGVMKNIITINDLEFPAGTGEYYLNVYTKLHNIQAGTDNSQKDKYTLQYTSKIMVDEVSQN